MKPESCWARAAAAVALLLIPPAEAAVAQTPNHQVPVSEPFAEPVFQSVCHLWIKRRVAFLFKPKFTGSAVLYRGRYLLTAGHNVYQDNSRIRNVEVRCGHANAASAPLHETIAPWQAIEASSYDGKPFARDFGVIRLNRPISVSEPVRLASIAAQSGDQVRIAGYPGGPHDGWNLFAAQGSVTEVSQQLIYYDIETFKSNSGGPVWREVDGKPELVGIHVTGSGGRIVDVEYVQEINRLIAELDRRASARAQ